MWSLYHRPSLVTAVMHNLCSMHALDQVRFCIYFALDFVDEATIMEQYGNEVGLAAFEWCGSRIQTFHLDRWRRVVHHFYSALWSVSAPFERYRTDLVLVLLRHGHLVDRIEENQKMVIVGVRLVSKFLPTMTLYCTIILDYCRVQLKKKKKK